MVQKAVRSKASSPNSLGPKQDWPEVRGEVHRPRTILSWLLAKKNMFECLDLVNLQDSHGVQGRGCLALAARAAVSLQALDGRRRQFLQVAAFHGHRCTATALFTRGMPAYPLAAPPTRVLRTEETDEGLLAVKGAIHDFFSSSYTSGHKYKYWRSSPVVARTQGAGKKAPEQSSVVSQAPLRETNHPAARAWDWAVC